MKKTVPFVYLCLLIVLLNGLPAVAQVGEQIAFVSNRSGNDDLYLMTASGENVQNLTDNPARDWHPDWSPDGRWLTFSSDRSGNVDIYALSLSDYREINLTSNPAADVSPDWSPDGRMIVFVSDRDEGYDLYLLDVTNGSVRRLTTDAAEKSAPDWSPDGRTIAYWARDISGVPQMFFVAADSGEVQPLGDLKNVNWPAWSPDGSVLAFEDVSTGTAQITLFHSATGEIVHLADGSSNEIRPAWSPDGAKLAYSSDADDNLELYIMNADGSRRQRLTQSDGDDSSPAWQHYTPTALVTQVQPASVDNPLSIVQSAIQLPPNSDLSDSQDAGAGVMTLDYAPRTPHIDQAIRVRVEVRLERVEDTTEGDEPVETQETQVHTIMGAELRGVDLERFQIDPNPTDYVLRLDLDEVNYWEWTLRPLDNRAVGINYLSADVYIPRVQPDGTVGKETVNHVNFQVEFSPLTPVAAITPMQAQLMATEAVSAAPASTTLPPIASSPALFSVIYNDVNSFVILTTNQQNLSGTTIAGAGYPYGEFYIDQDFPVLTSVAWEAGLCFSYVLDGSAPIFPRACRQNYELLLSPVDVFWYDDQRNARRDIVVRYANTTFTCASGSVRCDLGQ